MFQWETKIDEKSFNYFREELYGGYISKSICMSFQSLKLLEIGSNLTLWDTLSNNVLYGEFLNPDIPSRAWYRYKTTILTVGTESLLHSLVIAMPMVDCSICVIFQTMEAQGHSKWIAELRQDSTLIRARFVEGLIVRDYLARLDLHWVPKTHIVELCYHDWCKL